MTQTFRQFVNWLKMNTRHLTTWLKSCTELYSQINKESSRQCTMYSQKWDFFHPSWQRLAFLSFNKWGKTPCTSLPVSAWFLSKSPLLNSRERRERVAMYPLLCQPKCSGLEHEMRKNALQGLEKQLHVFLWSFSCAASLQEQIAFTYLLEQTWVERFP